MHCVRFASCLQPSIAAFNPNAVTKIVLFFCSNVIPVCSNSRNAASLILLWLSPSLFLAIPRALVHLAQISSSLDQTGHTLAETGPSLARTGFSLACLTHSGSALTCRNPMLAYVPPLSMQSSLIPPGHTTATLCACVCLCLHMCACTNHRRSFSAHMEISSG